MSEHPQMPPVWLIDLAEPITRELSYEYLTALSDGTVYAKLLFALMEAAKAELRRRGYLENEEKA